MGAGEPRDTDWSVAPTLGWFVVLLAAALLYADRTVDGVRELIDRAPGDGPSEPRSAGPTFVQKEDERQQQASDGEVDELEAAPAQVAEADAAAETEVRPAKTAIEDACLDGTAASCRRWAMDGYYDALARADQGLVRISLWGDSVTAEGYIAGAMRAKLIERHGDGGAGFVFLARPSRWYQNTAVRQSQSQGWVTDSITRKDHKDELQGYGGASFIGTAGDSVTFRTAKSGAGSKVSRVEVYYLARPDGGTAELSVDGELAATIDTAADTTTSGFTAVDVADGAHRIDLTVTSGAVRAYGITMERDTGVAVDSLGIVSNTAKNMAKNLSASHWQEQLAHRDADLMMILLGANESAWLHGGKEMKLHRANWDRVLARIRKGNPDGSCLVIGTLDAGRLEEGKTFVGREGIDGMVEAQRAAAAAHGCAFWDARAFMGGKDSSKKWHKRGLMSGDFEHLTTKGGRVLGNGIVAALETGYASRQSR